MHAPLCPHLFNTKRIQEQGMGDYRGAILASPVTYSSFRGDIITSQKPLVYLTVNLGMKSLFSSDLCRSEKDARTILNENDTFKWQSWQDQPRCNGGQ